MLMMLLKFFISPTGNLKKFHHQVGRPQKDGSTKWRTIEVGNAVKDISLHLRQSI